MIGMHGVMRGVAALLLTAALASPAWAQGADRIAVVDLRSVLERLDERQAVEAKARQAQQAAEAERATRLQEIESLRRDLLMLDGDARRAKEDEVVLRQAELEAFLKVQQNKMQRDAAAMIEGMRDKMEAAVEAVAKERGIQLVMTRSIQVTLPGPDGRPRQVPAPQVVWVAPEADITDAVIDRMNAEFARQGAAEPIDADAEPSVAVAIAEDAAP
ncbi:MAG: OmpH family outer membrane protein [Planctomycetota bacterium]